MESRGCAFGANGWKSVRSQRREDYFLFRNKAEYGASAGASTREVRRPLPTGPQVHRGVGRKPCAQALAGGERLPDRGARCRNCDLEDESLIGRGLGGCDVAPGFFRALTKSG